jgi:hypothetical protein
MIFPDATDRQRAGIVGWMVGRRASAGTGGGNDGMAGHAKPMHPTS